MRRLFPTKSSKFGGINRKNLRLYSQKVSTVRVNNAAAQRTMLLDASVQTVQVAFGPVLFSAHTCPKGLYITSNFFDGSGDFYVTIINEHKS